MTDKALPKATSGQWNQLITVLTAISNGLWAINDQLKPLDNAIDNNTKEVTKWLGAIAEAITDLNLQPQPKARGTIMSDYAIPADQPDGRVTFVITATDSEGNEITDPVELGKLPFDVKSSDPSVFEVTLDVDHPNGGERQGGYHAGSPGQAAITSNLMQVDGDIIATGTDGFTVTTGEPSIGAVTANFEGLTPIV